MVQRSLALTTSTRKSKICTEISLEVSSTITGTKLATWSSIPQSLNVKIRLTTNLIFVQKRWSTYFEALKLWNARSGKPISNTNCNSLQSCTAVILPMWSGKVGSVPSLPPWLLIILKCLRILFEFYCIWRKLNFSLYDEGYTTQSTVHLLPSFVIRRSSSVIVGQIKAWNMPFYILHF